MYIFEVAKVSSNVQTNLHLKSNLISVSSNTEHASEIACFSMLVNSSQEPQQSKLYLIY